MRMKNLIIGDINFQFKYGFYFVYTIVTILYVSLLYALPISIREKAGAVLVYTDPAAMGLFFMGAIVLLEKSQRVLNSIAISPVKVSEYILSKVISLGVISTVVGTLIAYAAGIRSISYVIIGTFLGSVMFSCIGLMLASRINSLNQFLATTVPFEIFFFIPPLIYLFGYRKNFMLLHPGCIIILLVSGEASQMGWLLLYLSFWILFIYFITHKVVSKMFQNVGGVKL